MTSTSLGKQIKEARKRAGMTQADVAEKMSISVQAVSQWETNRTIPNYRNLRDLQRLIGMSIDDDMTAKDFLQNLHISWEDPEVAVRAPVVDWKNPSEWGNVDPEDTDDEDPFRWIADDFLEVRWKPIGDVFALRVRNDYLKPDIAAGDFIIIDTGRAAEKNDVVVVETGDRVIFGRYMPMGIDEHRAPIFEIRNNFPSPPNSSAKRFDAQNPGRVIGVVREQRRYFRMD